MQGVPWDLTAGAIPKKKREKIQVKFAIPAPTVAEKDGELLRWAFGLLKG
jgi:hypothetical protein